MFFYLEWIDKRPTICHLLNEKPKSYNFSSQFKVKGFDEINICGNISNKFIEYYPDPKKLYKKDQYLQSHLQKCVRKKDSYRSIKTAKHLLDLDLIKFLRRLPIIMLEDVCIHESIIVIIWLMVAVNKGFRIRCEMIKWLLGVVNYLSNEDYKQYYSKLESNIIPPESHDFKDILYSLKIRKSYGGMKGDMNMIEYYIHNIINGDIIPKKDKIQLIKINMLPLEHKEWIYQANDFHCNKFIIPKIRGYIKNKKKYTEDYIKELIWLFSSSINNRVVVVIDKKKEKDWLEIKKFVKYIQKSCIFY
uniref:Uncharacterized protein n=1 Tax=viral metagenome TaxID=1070528 RepID=A0A6C0F723_9ZZZZ|tara:strand:- start:4379 stop:5290 length:912 start_codon:yes stop_codon:yes gene_type:complete